MPFVFLSSYPNISSSVRLDPTSREMKRSTSSEEQEVHISFKDLIANENGVKSTFSSKLADNMSLFNVGQLKKAS
ncbi:hypothetical protein AC1031_022018 [Aphanomyces cochlioides]|nr:hypothetical protein AC1031_022018 [Aphanomyces cochlioides]